MKMVFKSRIFLVIVTVFICISINVIADNLLASEIDYNNTTVDQALDNLYNLANGYPDVYEEGTFTAYIAKGNYIRKNLTFNNTYTADDNAMLVIDKVDYWAPIYYNHDTFTKLVGNTKDVTIINYAGDTQYSRTYTFNYKIIKFNFNN